MSSLQRLTDCKHFLNGHCSHGENCRYRHCFQATRQRHKVCFEWPQTCRNLNCRYLHPLPSSCAPNLGAPYQLHHSQPQRGPVSFFWDIENVHIPRAQNPSHIVQRLRNKFVHGPQLLELGFTCYVRDTSGIPRSVLVKLHHASVRIAHVPDYKPGAVDRQILLDLDRFERAHRPPATIVLISSDIDYVGKLNDLRNQVGYRVIVVHNKPVCKDLWTLIDAHYSWDMFTEPTDILFCASPVSLLYNCPECSNEFSTLDGLHQHQDAKNHLEECPMCDELFYTSNDLTEHQDEEDHYERNFSCHQCDRSFSTANRLSQHRNDSHRFINRETISIFAHDLLLDCIIDPSCPECSATFRTTQSLHHHQDAKQHTYDCPVCDETFYTVDEQDEHQEDENHFLQQCNICHRTVQTQDGLRQHKIAKFHF
jgi:uncharacterized C2H2 Zn-finger protein